MQMNLRFVRALQFLCQFNLDIHHKQSKGNIVPDALLQLASINTEKLSKNYTKLNALAIVDAQFTV